jgi:hypothetical protein
MIISGGILLNMNAARGETTIRLEGTLHVDKKSPTFRSAKLRTPWSIFVFAKTSTVFVLPLHCVRTKLELAVSTLVMVPLRLLGFSP